MSLDTKYLFDCLGLPVPLPTHGSQHLSGQVEPSCSSETTLGAGSLSSLTGANLHQVISRLFLLGWDGDVYDECNNACKGPFTRQLDKFTLPAALQVLCCHCIDQVIFKQNLDQSMPYSSSSQAMDILNDITNVRLVQFLLISFERDLVF